MFILSDMCDGLGKAPDSLHENALTGCQVAEEQMG